MPRRSLPICANGVIWASCQREVGLSDVVLVTGGAGYIGSHTVYALLDRGDKVVVLDDLSTGVKAQVGKNAVFVEGDVADTDLVKKAIAEHGVKSVIHFAGAIVVPDSVRDPLS